MIRSTLAKLLGLPQAYPAPRGQTGAIWSIGIYSGESPLALRPQDHIHNPVLTRSDVTDVQALFVADPFMIRVDGRWHMFFEVLNNVSHKGEIGYAVSNNGYEWEYRQIVLAEPFHLSYPCVFESRGDYYMIPETRHACEVRLYRASKFPTQWKHVTTLFSEPYADSTIFRFDNRWWLFADSSASFRIRHRQPALGFRHDTLRLFYSDDLYGPWQEHPQSPIVSCDPHIARPGGRVVLCDSLVRFAQDCYPTYGTRLYAFRITQLTAASYAESEIEEQPILMPSGEEWNQAGMHHIDAHLHENGSYIASVDGFFVGQV